MGVEEDDEKAFELYRQAADAGDVVAVFKLGEFYERGTGVEKDLDEAARWYRTAMETYPEVYKDKAEAALKRIGRL